VLNKTKLEECMAMGYMYDEALGFVRDTFNYTNIQEGSCGTQKRR
jgi:hypothetical protein